MRRLYSWFTRFLPKAIGYQMGDDSSRRTKGLNALLISMFFICLAFTILNSFLFPMQPVILVNAVSTLLALLTLLVFRATGNYQLAAHMAVALIMLCIIGYLHVVHNRYYAFIWIGIVPPIAYYLLNLRSVKVLLILFSAYMLYYLLSGLGKWPPAAFDGQSVLSIAAVTLCITGMLANLVRNRNEVLSELKDVGAQLDAQQRNLRLILDSAAEAIYGTDLEGNCTFCNRRCIEMLGYHDPLDLLGKNMHAQIHHSRSDGTPIPIQECIIYEALLQGKPAHGDQEVFWRADHTPFAVEYYAYPQIKDGDMIGTVVTFTDITERKKKEAEIEYLNCYDPLTGLHNRRCFEANRGKLDIPENLPIAILFADINGLKMTNDVFGHTAGDRLIQKSAEILRQACREPNLIARVGGDEFILFLPQTPPAQAEKIAASIRAGFADAKVEAIRCSISLGVGVKQTATQSMDEVLANAENAMYRDKTMNRKATDKALIDTILETLHARSATEQAHSKAVSDLSLALGKALHLPETDLSKLQRAAYLHDIGKIVLDPSMFSKTVFTDEDMERMQQHSAVGYRILSLFDDTLDLAEYVYGHHEKWDGTGYPRGLNGEQIPLLSRIIAIAESYDRILSKAAQTQPNPAQYALSVIVDRAGTQFDPNLTQVFAQSMAG